MALCKFKLPVVEGEEVDPAIDAYSQGFYAGDGNKGYSWSSVYEPKYGCIKRLVGKFNSSNSEKYHRVHWTHGPISKIALVSCIEQD